MEDHRLGDLLRELPREHARPGFTARVLQRLEASERPRRNPRLATAGALAAAAVLSASAGGVLVNAVNARHEAVEKARTQQALAEIRAEHLQLERDFQELSQPPVVYLGGNEDVDLVLDLGKVHGSEGATPVAYHGETF